tara:strand:- start:7135 stop:7359 length:225 start_codon:yes stop_codon:yes gene_type:complete
MSNYNGWKNYETWNVALWIGNEEHLYVLAKKCKTYEKFLSYVCRHYHDSTTGDGVKWRDKKIDISQINNFFNEL